MTVSGGRVCQGMSGYEMEQDERALASRMTVLDLSLLTVTRSALSSQEMVYRLYIYIERTETMHSAQELCESRGSRPGLSVLTGFMVSIVSRFGLAG